jgi:ABC-2 type transport system permease protein
VSVVAQAAAPRVNLSVVRWVGFKTIVIREYGRIIRIWAQTIVPSAVTAVSLIFTHLHVEHPLVVVTALLLSSAIFALAGFLNALYAKNFDQVNWIPAFVLTPLTYFGGVFYSVSLLPEWARQLSYVNPILYMVNAFRFGFLGVSDVHIGAAFALMGGAGLLLFGVCVTLMNRGTGIRE